MENTLVRTRAGYFFDKQAVINAVESKKYTVLEISKIKEVYKCACCGKRTSPDDLGNGEFFAVNQKKEIKAVIGGRAEKYIFVIDGDLNDEYKLVKIGDSCWKKLFQNTRLPQFDSSGACREIRADYWKINRYKQ